MSQFNLKALIFGSLAFLTLGVYLGSTFFPKVQTKEVQTEVTKKDVVTVTKEITKPDGTKEVVIMVTDHSKQIETSVKTTVPPAVKKTNVSVLVSTDFNNLMRPNYGISVNHEIFANITAGLFAMKDGTLGLSIGLNF